MNRENIKKLMPVIQAFAEGKVIQFRVDPDKENEWNDMDKPSFEYMPEQYRIKPDSELMTNRQLAMWLSKGMGQSVDVSYGDSIVSIRHVYSQTDEDYAVDGDIRIRRWDSDEWITPTVEVFEKDCAFWIGK